jgi:hypothetical protein
MCAGNWSDPMTFAAVFAIIVGAGMFGQWLFFYVTGQIVELKTEPVRIGFHLAGECLTAVALIVGGAGLLLDLSWSRSLLLLAMGMLFYTAVVSPGYFAQKGQWPLVVMFAVLLLLALVATALLF